MGDHLVPLDVLLALAALGLAGGVLGRVQGVPVVPVQEVHALGPQQLLDRRRFRVRRGELLARLGVGKQVGDGLVGVALGVTNQADGAAADPAGGVKAGDVGGGLVAGGLRVDDAAADVRNDVLDPSKGMPGSASER